MPFLLQGHNPTGTPWASSIWSPKPGPGRGIAQSLTPYPDTGWQESRGRGGLGGYWRRGHDGGGVGQGNVEDVGQRLISSTRVSKDGKRARVNEAEVCTLSSLHASQQSALSTPAHGSLRSPVLGADSAGRPRGLAQALLGLLPESCHLSESLRGQQRLQVSGDNQNDVLRLTNTLATGGRPGPVTAVMRRTPWPSGAQNTTGQREDGREGRAPLVIHLTFLGLSFSSVTWE